MGTHWVRWIVGTTIVLVIIGFGFSFTVYEGDVAVVTRFGSPRQEVRQSGIHWKLPWPFETVFLLDGRQHYFDSSFAETLTRDKRNIILQTYTIWSIDEPQKFLQSIGETRELAEGHLNSMIINAKNGVLGRYDMSALVSTNSEELKLSAIEQEIYLATRHLAKERYGIEIHQIGLKRLGLPEANLGAVMQQMRSERRQLTARYTAEGRRDASEIRNETDILTAQIEADGRERAAEIIARTEADVAQIYAEAYSEEPDLFLFLRRLESMERILGPQTTLIFSMDNVPFSVLNEHLGEGR